MQAILRILLNANLRALAAKYGFSIAKQLVRVGLDYVRVINVHRGWTEEERHAYLATQLKTIDVVEGTNVDDDAIAIVVDYFLGPKEANKS